jgi:hypothetical protein
MYKKLETFYILYKVVPDTFQVNQERYKVASQNASLTFYCIFIKNLRINVFEQTRRIYICRS